MDGNLWRTLEELSPSLVFALAAALVLALLYAALAARPMRAVPVYWAAAIAGIAAGQLIANRGPRLVMVGNLALGTGVMACIVLFIVVHLATLWYTGARRTRVRAQSHIGRRERLHR